jgi:hypothetical protein
MTWHAPPDLLTRFAQAPEALDEVTASSVEQHLVACDTCRTALAGAVSPVDLQRTWAEVADAIDQPGATVVERLLARLGMPDDLARAVGATPGLQAAWLATAVLLATAAVWVGRASGSEALFLAVAPLLPLGAVLLTFLPTEEPGGEAAAATPRFGAGVLLWRALAALVPSFVVLGLAAVALPDLVDGASWLLPGLALALSALALATYVRPVAAIGALATAWLALLTSVRALDGRRVPLDATFTFSPGGQLLAVVLATFAAGVLYLRSDRFSTLEVVA